MVRCTLPVVAPPLVRHVQKQCIHPALILATTPELVTECQSLRHVAFCEESKIFALVPNEIEQDEYDTRSAHALLRCQVTGTVVGAVRLVLNVAGEQFPTETLGVREFGTVPWRCHVGEISRFCVSSDALSSTPVTREQALSGLMRAVFHMSWDNHVTHWYATMAPSLLRLLARSGVNFEKVGGVVDYYGARQPCVALVSEVFAGIAAKNATLARFIESR